jgi:hypothetical protein
MAANQDVSAAAAGPRAGLCALVLACGFAGVASAQAPDPARMPARESHEGLTIALDPYVDAARAKEKFGKKNPHQANLLAVEVFFKNETNQAIRVHLEEIRLLIAPPGSGRQRLEPLDLETVIEKTLQEKKGGPEVQKPRLPVPIPRANRSKEWKKLEAQWEMLLLSGDVLPPQSVMRGFLFFDMGLHMDWAAYSRLLVPRLKFVESGKEMFFFEVDLGRAPPRP